ncbi:hypothetical protein B0H67DRAFT_646287 [Lasiosphaeris hirsuta]|uniref:Uncharacterized protein n=1 Tax=Lasiosphaeris hirsuta TaxID=260670 RepID=A0AA40A807_9PEZI|nr:hypothetical protein B0H67DRAFT_646287 [Lasiosphaeris hirsuta]
MIGANNRDRSLLLLRCRAVPAVPAAAVAVEGDDDEDEDDEAEEEKTGRQRQQLQQRTGGGVVDIVLELIVRGVLAGAQMLVVIAWVVGRVSAVLEFVVELGVFLIQAPN